MLAVILLLNWLAVNPGHAAKPDCRSAVAKAQAHLETEFSLQDGNPSLPRRFFSTFALHADTQSLTRKHGQPFSSLIGFDVFAFGPGPGVGQARSLASHVASTLAANLSLTATEKAVLWREARNVFQALSPEWGMKEIPGTNPGEFIFQGTTPSLPNDPRLPVLYIAADGKFYRGSLAAISTASELREQNVDLSKTLKSY